MYEDRPYFSLTPKSTRDADEEFEEHERLARLLQRLRENEAQREDLKVRECLYLKTRDPALLDEFRDNREYPRVKLKERFTEPCALFNQDNFLATSEDPEDLKYRQQMIEEMKADARRFNPKAEIREVDTANGERRLAIIGVDGPEFWAFHDMCRAERRLEQSIERDTSRVHELVSQQKDTMSEPENAHNALPNTRLPDTHIRR